MQKMMAAVEKLAGKIKTITKKTGSHSGNMLSVKVMVLSLILVRYLAT